MEKIIDLRNSKLQKQETNVLVLSFRSDDECDNNLQCFYYLY